MSANLAFFILACVACVAVAVRAYRVILREEAWLPKELSTAKLVFSEQLFTGPPEMPIVARIDRVYQSGGLLYLVELKTRRRATVYETDVIELSAQRVAVQASTGTSVGLKAFVVIENSASGRRQVRVVRLLSEDQVAAFMKRRRMIIDGLLLPDETEVQARCGACEYRRECKGEAGARVYPLVRLQTSRAGKHGNGKVH